MSKPTAGPWEVDPTRACVRTGSPFEQDYICDLFDQSNDLGKDWEEIEYCGDNRGDEIRSNARLIAASPDLLAALKRRLDPQHITTDAEDEADRQLIARIEGEA